MHTQVDWEVFDSAQLWQSILLWVSKKVKELLGEEEASLVKFIVDKVTSSPHGHRGSATQRVCTQA